MSIFLLSVLIASLGAGSDSFAVVSAHPDSMMKVDEAQLVSQPVVRNRDSLVHPDRPRSDSASSGMNSPSGAVEPEPDGDNVREYWWMSPEEVREFRRRQALKLTRGQVGHSISRDESERQYWWMSLGREAEIKRKARQREYGSYKEYLDLDLMGLRIFDGWYRMQLGLVVAPGPREWRLHFGGGVLREVDNSTIDLVRRREMESGYEIRLWEERIVRGPGPLSFYFGFGPRARMGWQEATVDSSQNEFVRKETRWVSGGYLDGVYVAGHYENAYKPTQATRRSWSAAVLAGTGIRLHSETGMALVGGMEFGSEWSLAKTSVQSAKGAGRETDWAMIEPNWTLGVDWFF